MKLDSEEQREQLLKLLSTVTYTVTEATIDQAKAQIDSLFGAIRNAGIEMSIVPIEDLEPDEP
jgi:hypothetical protein